MGTLRIHTNEMVRALTTPAPWWDDTARATLQQVLVGEPGIETDDNDEPTGWLLIAHPSIGTWEQWLLEVYRAGWAYVDTLTTDEATALVEYQAATDWAAFDNLRAGLEAGKITHDEAWTQITAYMAAAAARLGIAPPDLSPADDEP